VDQEEKKKEGAVGLGNDKLYQNTRMFQFITIVGTSSRNRSGWADQEE